MFPSSITSATRIPLLLSTSERTFIDDLAGRILDAGIEVPNFGQEGAKVARTIADPTADPSVPICLCSGTGQLLGETLGMGFRLTPPAERATAARAADALAARIVVAMAPSAESADEQDSQILNNVYRAGLGLPVQSWRLGEDQLGIIAREARVFAGLMNLVIRVGDEEMKNDSMSTSLEGAMHALQEKGQTPALTFVDRATGGRPGVIGSISLVAPETFFASFSG